MTDGKMTLEAGVQWLTKANRDRARLVYTSPKGYIVLHTGAAEELVHVQISAGRQAPEGEHWPAEIQQEYYDAGLRQARVSANFRGKWIKGQLNQGGISTLTQALTKGFGEGIRGEAWECSEENVAAVQTNGVEDAMNYLAKNRTWQARTGLYRMLLKSRLLVVVEDEGIGKNTQFKSIDTIGSHSVYGAFTSYEALDAFSPLPTRSIAVPGEILFPELVSARAGALRLNPGTTPTGELYGNELMIIVDGIKRMQGVH